MSEPTRAYDRMLAGLPYRVPDAELNELQVEATRRFVALNATEGLEGGGALRRKMLREALGAFGESFFNPPIRWEYGRHIFVGDSCLINSECNFLDGAEIRIDDRTLIAPRCQFVTAGHPLAPEERMVLREDGTLSHGVAVNAPIHIARNCWIGAGAIILGGVTIGEGTMVGAGSVVTRSLPPRVLAAGNPARVIRSIPGPANMDLA